MEELKELRLESNVLILDGHRVISPIIPRKYADIDNDVIVKGETYIDGAVYARKIDVQGGPLTVCGALFARDILQVHSPATAQTYFHKAVACGNLIDVKSDARTLFGADANAKVLRLKNAVVAANVFASEILLENCIVLGGAFATKSLTIDHSVIGTFNAPNVQLSGDIYMLYPSVFSVEPIRPAEGCRLINLTLADFGNLMRGLPENEMSGKLILDPKVDEQQTRLTDKDGNETLWETYSVAGKVLAADLMDFKKLQSHFLLSVGALNEQLLREYDLGCDKNGVPVPLSLPSIGDFFSKILEGSISVKTLSADFSFDELKKFYADN